MGRNTIGDHIMELQFVEEAIPDLDRGDGAGRQAEKWEEHLAPLKADKLKGKSFRIASFEKKTQATSRSTVVRERLLKATPFDNWTIRVREVPNESDTFGVYVKYEGTFTPEQVAENAKVRAERSAKIKARLDEEKAKAVANGNTAPADSPAARVAEARAKATK